MIFTCRVMSYKRKGAQGALLTPLPFKTSGEVSVVFMYWFLWINSLLKTE